MKILNRKSVTSPGTTDLPFHPCIHPEAHRTVARIHLPVAFNCNLTCRYCARQHPCVRPDLPGTSTTLMRPAQALKHLIRQRKIWGEHAVVGISGPGEPLANPETFETLARVRALVPSHPLCLCTNGLLLKDKLRDIVRLGIRVITITMNGINPHIVKFLQPGLKHGKIFRIGTAAAALGKSLLGGARTEVFAPRVVKLSHKLKAQGKMLWCRTLCFTRYVIAVPKGNPAGIESIADLEKPGVRVVLSFGASPPPGGKATMVILHKAGVLEGARENAVFNGDCVQRTTTMLTNGKADAAVVEQRITRLPEFFGKLDTIPIDERYFPAPPMTFTIGVMKWARDRKVAGQFIDFILSPHGRKHFARAGFIPAGSDERKRLAIKYGVRHDGMSSNREHL